MTYRPDLDFLRAIAVMSVILYHAGVPQFQSGFIGVDLFFVLSGYLIGAIATREITEKSFSAKDFLERRARRILPALFFVTLFNFPLVLYVFAPSQIENVLKGFISISTFTSNFFFWRQSGYFDPKSEFQPFLHTWSVGVEIQFYILFCFLIVLSLKQNTKSTLTKYTWILLVASVTLSMLFSFWKPGIAFYLLPSRLWEFLAGSLVAFFEKKIRKDRDRSIFFTPLKFTSLVLILASLTKSNSGVSWPNIGTFIPVIATCMFIYARSESKLSKSVFHFKPLVFTGRVSYGWFLWHWPLIVYFNYFTDLQVSSMNLLIVSVTALAIAIVQWRWLETPLRDRRSISTNRFYKVIVAQFLIILIISSLGIFSNGYQKVWSEIRYYKGEKIVVSTYLKREMEEEIEVRNSDCMLNYDQVINNQQAILESCSRRYGKAIQIIGDSHGLVFYDIIFKSGIGKFVINWSRPTSRPQSGIDGQYKEVLEFTRKNAGYISRVLFMQSGSYLLEDQFGRVDSAESFREEASFKTSERSVIRTFDYLRELSSQVEVVWIGPYVESRMSPDNPQNWYREKEIPKHVVEVFSQLDSDLKTVAKEQNIKYISSQPHFKFENNRILVGDCIVWRDQDHWSKCGRELLAVDSRVFLQNLLLHNEKT
jgi:peptidoglycan/LPS O-acetylase OafA/YrhL